MEVNELLRKIVENNYLNQEEAEFLGEYLTGESMDPCMASSILTAMETRGENADEIHAIIRVLQKKMVRFRECDDCIDMAGTGGSKIKIGNISTISSFVVASAGVKVIKHGNRSFNHNVGSADILEKLGIDIHMSPERAYNVLEKTGITFLFAQDYHPAIKNIAQVRRKLKIKTIFNFIGPFLNPANVKRQVIGFSDPAAMEIGAKIAILMKKEKVMLVHSDLGIDEFMPSGKNTILDIENGKILRKNVIFPELNLPLERFESERVFFDVLNNRGNKFVRDAVVLNSSLGLIVAGKANDLKDAMEISEYLLESGRALEKFYQFKEEAGKNEPY